MQNFFKWKDSYDLGVHDMNEEHKVLISIMNKLFRYWEEGKEFEVLRDTIDELGSYTLKHFEDEERYMESLDYPDLKVHKIIHQDLLKKFKKYQEEFQTSGEISEKFFDFLKLWLSAHIQGIDMKYARHSKEGAA